MKSKMKINAILLLVLVAGVLVAAVPDAEAVNRAATFDGRDDYISVMMDVPETNFTIEFWFKTRVLKFCIKTPC